MGIIDTYTMVSRLRVVLGVEGQEHLLVGAKVEYSYPTVFSPSSTGSARLLRFTRIAEDVDGNAVHLPPAWAD